MKKTFKQTIAIIGTLAYLLIGTFAFAQAPQKFNYQGIARDAKGNPMSKQTLALKLSVLPTSDATVPEYEETQLVTTNEFGLYTLQIGNGTAVTGEMKTVKWETGNKYIKVAIDPTGGTNYVDAGTNQLLSVPYALYADRAGEAREGAGSTTKATRATNNYIEKTNGAGVANSTSLLYDNGSNIGMGTTAPAAKFHMNGAGTNELRIQSAGGSPRLSFFGDAATGFTSTANYALMYKRPATDVGNFSTGFANAKLFIFGNAQGSLLFNTGGNVGFGYFDQAANTTTTNLFVEGTSGNTGIGTAAPTRKMQMYLPTSSYNAYKISNSTTGATAGDGFEMGLSGSTGYLWNWEDGITHFGTNNQFRMSILGNGNVGIGTTAPTEKFHVIDNDTAGLFQSNNASGGSTIQGIVRAEYTGTATINDHVGVYGKVTNTSAGWGIGVKGEGNYYGVYGLANGSGNGVVASSSTGTGLSANTSSGSYAVYGYNGSGSYGGYLNAYGTQSSGLYSYGDSIGTESRARFIGAYNIADNSSTGTLTSQSYGSYNTGTSSNYRSYGLYAGAVGGIAGWNSYGLYSTVSGVGSTLYAGYFDGYLYATSASAGVKAFTIDHPLDPANKVLRHSSIESNDMMNLYNGNITTDANGYATVTMPTYFDALNENFKYQLTVIGTFAQAIIKEEMANSQFVIQTNQPNVKVSWQVAGVRHDAVAKKFPIVVEEAKTGENVGHYYEPTAYGVSEKLGIGYTEKVNQQEARAEQIKREEERKAIEKMHEDANK